jgi:hypothetical protein
MVSRKELVGTAWVIVLLSSWAAGQTLPASEPVACEKADGYHGIWAAMGELPGEYKYLCSGGMATYSNQHRPMACYCEKADKTFFVYGGMPADGYLSEANRKLQVMVSWYDHKTGVVARPRVLLTREVGDPEDNPVLAIDAQGRIWVFVGANGTARPAFIFRSTEPYTIDSFEKVRETTFSKPQAWYVPGGGFVLLHSLYSGPVSQLCVSTSKDGVTWTEPVVLAAIEAGDYQVSWQYKDKIGTAFEYHPYRGAESARTNLYYMETRDFGKSWVTARGEKLDLPLKTVDNKAMVYDYGARRRLVYVQDLSFDPRGNPVILYIVSRSHYPGSLGGPRLWATARWVGRKWEMTGSIPAENNFDSGFLIVQRPDFWWFIATTDPGPRPFYSGGEVMEWFTRDQGSSWGRRTLTAESRYNQNFVQRPLNAYPGFVAFWSDGDSLKPSECHLYFADLDGHVYCLPWAMTGETEKPALLPKPGRRPTPQTSQPSASLPATTPGR